MKYLLILVIVGLGIGGYWWFTTQPFATEENTPIVTDKTSELSDEHQVDNSVQTYRNDEWGIAFEYPNEWEIREPAFGSSVSLFNLTIESSVEKKLPDPIIVNITPKYWVERIINSTPSEEFIDYKINGRGALYYSSFDMGIPMWSYFVLVNNTYWINIAGKKEYEDVLSQVIESFEITPIEIGPSN